MLLKICGNLLLIVRLPFFLSYPQPFPKEREFDFGLFDILKYQDNSLETFQSQRAAGICAPSRP
jgi:hypothetical protein